MVAETRMMQGPLPSPETLADYERLHPGTAAIIVEMAQNEQRQRIISFNERQAADIRHREALVAMQTEDMRRTHFGDFFGQVCGWILGLACIGGAVFTAISGAPAIVSVALVSLPVAAIIKAVRNGRGDEAQRKR